MSAPTYRCRSCGGIFQMNAEEQEIASLSGAHPEYCEECWEQVDHNPGPDEFSDADPGL